MPALTKLQQNRRVVQDFTVNSLAGIPGPFARLVYLASLRDLSSGRYEHQGLVALYPEEAVQQALELCHEQIFERILEMPLEKQLEDLRNVIDRERLVSLALIRRNRTLSPRPNHSHALHTVGSRKEL